MKAEVGRYFATLDGYGQGHLRQVILLQDWSSCTLIPCLIAPPPMKSEAEELSCEHVAMRNRLLNHLSLAAVKILYDVFMLLAGPALRGKLTHVRYMDHPATLPIEKLAAPGTGCPPSLLSTFVLALLVSLFV